MKDNVLFTNEKSLLFEFAGIGLNRIKLNSLKEKYNLDLRITKKALNFNQNNFIFNKYKID